MRDLNTVTVAATTTTHHHYVQLLTRYVPLPTHHCTHHCTHCCHRYAQELHDNFGISFNELFTITNMPIKRFADHLYKSGELEKYMQLLVDNFNPATIPETMCRSLVSVSCGGQPQP